MSAIPYLLLLFAIAATSAISLDRNVGKPASYDWDKANTWAKDAQLTPIFTLLKQYKIPAAAIGYQLNPDPKTISYTPPKKWRNPQAWWMAGFGVSYRAPMRVASVSKPLTHAVYQNYLKAYTTSKFYTLWKTYVGALPEPKDPRVKLITIQHLINHKSGFDNGLIGFDPAFKGKSVASQVPNIVKSAMLVANPGAFFSYSNFGYMILAQIAEGITGKSFITLVRQLFPAGAPVFAASDTVPVPASGPNNPGAAEPGIYYVQSPDGTFDVSVMKGNGNIVSNVATLTWFASQYWLGGGNEGAKFTEVPVKPGYTWIWNGAMPGTMAVLVQYTTPKSRVSSLAVIINTRVPGNKAFFESLNSAAATVLKNKFKSF